MTCSTPQTASSEGRILANAPVCAGMRRLDLELPRPAGFLPGQFAMLNFRGRDELVFGRPMSILAAEGPVVSFLYRVAGEGTARLAAAPAGTALHCLGPLGRPFPPRAAGGSVLLLAGGVGLPPLLAWHAAHGAPDDLALFGARSPADVPWSLLGPAWQVSVDRDGPGTGGRACARGTVLDLAAAQLAGRGTGDWRVLACGPLPMLRAAAALAAARGWPCLVSVEERMGCGYGVCRGCVVPARSGGWLTACQEGPVLDAAAIDWDRYGAPPPDSAAAPGAGPGGRA